MTPKLGVQMFTLRKYTQTADDLQDALRRIREMGYRSIQVSAFGDISPGVIADLCREHDLEIGATHVAWDRFRHDLNSVMDEHKLWQCRHTAIGMLPPSQYLSLKGLDRFLAELNPIARRLAEKGISFSYHNHAHEFRQFDGKSWLQHLYDAASPDLLKAELDTHWIQAGGGDPAWWIENCGARMPLLHLKDFSINEASQRIFAPVGEGNMNWVTIIGAAMKHPIEYFFVEQDACYGEDEFDCLRRSYNYLTEFGLR